mmetsp:Transcript_13888/g.9809  ORF Transcript_13888/g.9809 Transcript_13888/m.9809 type:complete len:104 (+) Transcript_13888:19-330(+)
MECNNVECIEKLDMPTKQQLRARYANVKFIACPQCNSAFYCSQRCLQQDLHNDHLFKCKGTPGDLIDSGILKRIEKTTPFIKAGSLRDANQVEEERAFARMTL